MKFKICRFIFVTIAICSLNSTLASNSAADKIISKGKLNCVICKAVALYGFTQIRTFNTSQDKLTRRIKSLCKFYYGSISSAEVCDGLVDRMVPSLYYIIRHRLDLDRNKLCGYIFQQFGCNNGNDPKLDWSMVLPPHLDLANGSQADLEEDIEVRVAKSLKIQKPIKILHMTDLHIDPLYAVGSEANCENQVLCCHRGLKTYKSKKNGQGSERAGQFGHKHKCDPPLSFLNLTLQHLAKEHKDIDLFYMSGDIVPHSVYYTTMEDNIAIVDQVSKLIYEYFPNITVIPMVGNHEPHPVNMFSPPGVPLELSTRWVYNTTYESWKQWIPIDQKENYFKEGFYKVEISDTFKIISINTNVCYGLNFWGMLGETKDPGGQLLWLMSELDSAEKKGQKVHIVGHIAPAHVDCSQSWSKNFYQIITRYHNTIKGQFYGHTHHDSFKIYFGPTKSIPGGEGICREPVNTIFISPSLTGYKGNNPSFKLFYADPSTLEILDYEAYIFDLDEAKRASSSIKKNIEWSLLYRASNAYGTDQASPSSLSLLIDKMADNETLFDLYYRHFYSSPSRIEVSESVKMKFLCEMVEQYGGLESHECQRLKVILDLHKQRRQEKENKFFTALWRPLQRLRRKIWPLKMSQIGNCNPKIAAA